MCNDIKAAAFDVLYSNFSWVIWSLIPNNKANSKAKLPVKIKLFFWQPFQDAVLTRGNMRKRNWLGCPKCSFCDDFVTSSHLFFSHVLVLRSSGVFWEHVWRLLHATP